MKIFISPAKKMEECPDLFEPGSFPQYLERTELLYEKLAAMEEPELKTLFKANDAITHQNYLRFRSMDLRRAQTPALLSYVGIQYQYMAPKLFSYGEWDYLKKHLRILSGFYGILRPDDRVTPYRLEMQAKLAADGASDLYGFWGDSLYRTLIEGEESPAIVNLASKEYSKAVEPYLTDQVRYVTCVFGTLQGNTVKVKATEAKMARGEMVRYMAQNKIEDVEQLCGFSSLGYRYSKERSTKEEFIFIKQRNEENDNVSQNWK